MEKKMLSSTICTGYIPTNISFYTDSIGLEQKDYRHGFTVGTHRATLLLFCQSKAKGNEED